MQRTWYVCASQIHVDAFKPLSTGFDDVPSADCLSFQQLEHTTNEGDVEVVQAAGQVAVVFKGDCHSGIRLAFLDHRHRATVRQVHVLEAAVYWATQGLAISEELPADLGLAHDALHFSNRIRVDASSVGRIPQSRDDVAVLVDECQATSTFDEVSARPAVVLGLQCVGRERVDVTLVQQGTSNEVHMRTVLLLLLFEALLNAVYARSEGFLGVDRYCYGCCCF
ncbi:hypothetical protein D3C71_840830 [compost metagenome]